MSKNYFDITLGLAGICQAVYTVQQFAYGQAYDHDAMVISLESLVKTNPSSTLDVYSGEPCNLKLGLNVVANMMIKAGANKQVSEQTRYLFGVIILARRLLKNPQALEELSQRLEQLKRQVVHFDWLSETVFLSVADIYVEVISKLGPRIQILGSQTALQNTLNQARIRATLLAAIRSAVLWYQVGGSRLQFVFSRKKILSQVYFILAKCA